MKFFSLLSGDSVHSAPGVKKIPGTEFSRLIEAEELIQKIREEETELHKEIAAESEKKYAEAREKGREEGLQQWVNQLKFLEEEIRKTKKDLEKFIAKVALATAKKIVGRELKQHPETVVDIVAKNLKSVSGHKKITIFIHKNDERFLKEKKESLRAIMEEELLSFSIRTRDDITEGGAIIETEAGIIDARVETLWEKIETAFESLIDKS